MKAKRSNSVNSIAKTDGSYSKKKGKMSDERLKVYEKKTILPKLEKLYSPDLIPISEKEKASKKINLKLALKLKNSKNGKYKPSFKTIEHSSQKNMNIYEHSQQLESFSKPP